MLELTTSQRGTPSGASEFVAAMAMVARHATDLLVLVDREGAIRYANPVACATFGISLEDALGTNAISYLHRDDTERVTSRFV